MESFRLMTPDEFREKIRIAAFEFTSDVIAVFAETLANAAEQFAATPGAPKPAFSQPLAPKAAPLPSAPLQEGRRVRRSLAELENIGAEVLKLLALNRNGLRVEQINRILGTNTRQLMRPLQKMFIEGKIRKTGRRRATAYAIA